MAPTLFNSLHFALEKSALRRTQNTALIMLKKAMGPLECSSYTPISLLFTDARPIAKVLALRLDCVRRRLDQLGRDSLWTIYIGSFTASSAVLSLEAEKSFNRTEWKFRWIPSRRVIKKTRKESLTLFASCVAAQIEVHVCRWSRSHNSKVFISSSKPST